MADNTLILEFETELSKIEKISIKNVKETISEEEINTIANGIIEKNVLFGKTGDYKTLTGATIESKTVTKII